MNCVFQDPAYGRLKDHLIAETGLAFYADRDAPLSDVIGERLSALGLGDCSSYAEFLVDGPAGNAEMDVLITQLTIGETYFFRDEEQFAALRDVILPDILQRNRKSRQLRIWSAGCASGAEPYSLAILLARRFGARITGWQIGIHATDLNREFLAQAAAGRFRAAALRSTSDAVKRECFSKDGPFWTIHPRYKEWISFHYLNLADDRFSLPWFEVAPFDLILCRNVMIYFTRQVNRRVIGQFHQSLRAGGWLVVGAAEYNLDQLRVFRTVKAAAARLFQKAALPPQPAEVAPGPSVRASQEPPPAPVPPPLVIRDLEGLRRLADRGDWHTAAEYSKRLLTEDGLNAEIHFYHALIFEKLGFVDEPERSLRNAIYLDRNFALAHYHLGIELKRRGKTGAAVRSFGNVLKVLAALPDLATVTAGPGITVLGLKDLARMYLGTSNTA